MATFNRGDVIGRYSLIKFLGKGGMGEVWRATDVDPQSSDGDVALKILTVSQDESGLSIQREIMSLERVSDHDGICQLIDAGTDHRKKVAFLALEFLDGRDLADEVQRAGGRLALERALPILLDVLDGLGYAHSRGVVHRDLKPANVRVLSSGRAKIMDFGIAKLRSVTRGLTLDVDRASKSIGTPEYMAPEQWGKEVNAAFGKVDGRTDLYSFGIMLYEVLTGALPFKGVGAGLGFQHQESEAPALRGRAPELPAALEEVYRRLVAKRKEDRYASAKEARSALEDACRPALVGGRAASGAPDAPAAAPKDGSSPAILGVQVPTTKPLAPTLRGGEPATWPVNPTPSQHPTAGVLPPSADRPPTVANLNATKPLDAVAAEALSTAPLRAAVPSTQIVEPPTAPVPRSTPAVRAGREAETLPMRPAARPPLPEPRLQLRVAEAPGAPERVLHVLVGRRALLGRDRSPSPDSPEDWTGVPDWCLRYLPLGDPALRPLTQGTISRRQLEIEAGHTSVTVRDVSSKGTQLSDKPLPRGVATPVRSGQRLRMGPGPLRLSLTIHEHAETRAISAIHMARLGNGEAHGYLLLTAAAPVGSAPESALVLPALPGVLPHHATLVPLAPSGAATEDRPGLAISASAGAEVSVNAQRVKDGALAPLKPGDEVRCGAAVVRVQAYAPNDDDAWR